MFRGRTGRDRRRKHQDQPKKNPRTRTVRTVLTYLVKNI